MGVSFSEREREKHTLEDRTPIKHTQAAEIALCVAAAASAWCASDGEPLGAPILAHTVRLSEEELEAASPFRRINPALRTEASSRAPAHTTTRLRDLGVLRSLGF